MTTPIEAIQVTTKRFSTRSRPSSVPTVSRTGRTAKYPANTAKNRMNAAITIGISSLSIRALRRNNRASQESDPVAMCRSFTSVAGRGQRINRLLTPQDFEAPAEARCAHRPRRADRQSQRHRARKPGAGPPQARNQPGGRHVAQAVNHGVDYILRLVAALLRHDGKADFAARPGDCIL